MQITTSYHDTKKAIERAISKFGEIDGVLFVTPAYRDQIPDGIEDENTWESMRSRDLDSAFQVCRLPSFLWDVL